MGMIKIVVSLCVLSVLLLGCVAPSAPKNVTPGHLFSRLPNTCPTPDAMVQTPKGDVILSCPNFASKTQAGMLLRLSAKGVVTELGKIPGLKAFAQPMGLAFDDRGNLYVANNEANGNGNILKVQLRDGRVSGSEVVAKGFASPNGLRYRDGFLYLTQLQMPRAAKGSMVSGLYRIPVNARNLQVAGDLTAPQLIFHDVTLNPKRQFGLDGIVFGPQGSLYVTNFGDGKIYRLSLSASGRVKKKSLFAQLPLTVGLDGLTIDRAGNLYVAGFLLNQIYQITPQGKVNLIADYPDNRGDHGGIDQPADVMVYGNKLLISNFDLMKGAGIRNSGHGRPYTISYIPL